MKTLGMILDFRLTGIPQLEALKMAIARRIRVLACLTNKSWGCGQKTLRDLYVSHIRPKIEFPSPILALLCESSQKKVIAMENVCARIITGCVSFRTRTPDVLFLADLPSIRNRIKLRNATIFETVKRLGHEAAAYKTTNVDPPPPSRRGKAPEAPASWRTVALESVEAAGLTNNRLPLYFDKELSPADRARLRNRVCFFLNTAADPPLPTGTAITVYTDGSFYQSSEIGGGGVLITLPNGLERSLSFPLGVIHCSMEAELLALVRAIREIVEISPSPSTGEVFFYTDSLSWLQALEACARSYRVDETWFALSLLPSHLRINFVFVRGHSGIRGNEKADSLAKAGADSCPIDLVPPISLTAAKNKLKRSLSSIDSTSISDRLASSIAPPPKCRKRIEDNLDNLDRNERVIINQLRAGKSPLTHDFLHTIGKVTDPLCPACASAQDSHYHLLLYCPEYEGARIRHLGHNPSLTMLETDPGEVVAFLRKVKRDRVFIPENKKAR